MLEEHCALALADRIKQSSGLAVVYQSVGHEVELRIEEEELLNISGRSDSLEQSSSRSKWIQTVFCQDLNLDPCLLVILKQARGMVKPQWMCSTTATLNEFCKQKPMYFIQSLLYSCEAMKPS